MYKSLRANISMAELMDRATNDDQEGVQSLMNIVMQLRKVRLLSMRMCGFGTR